MKSTVEKVRGLQPRPISSGWVVRFVGRPALYFADLASAAITLEAFVHDHRAIHGTDPAPALIEYCPSRLEGKDLHASPQKAPQAPAAAAQEERAIPEAEVTPFYQPEVA